MQITPKLSARILSWSCGRACSFTWPYNRSIILNVQSMTVGSGSTAHGSQSWTRQGLGSGLRES